MVDQAKPSDDLQRLTEEVLEEIVQEETRSTGLERERVEKKDRSLARKRRTEWICFTVSLPLLIIFTALNLTGRGPFQIGAPTVSESEINRYLLEDLEFVVREVLTYQEESGSLPVVLRLLNLKKPNLKYTIVGPNHFQIQLTHESQMITFDSVRDSYSFYAEIIDEMEASR
ncbi:MAG: hypothetical protein V3R94_02840 [Acidobacteriota bacterium]